MIDDSDNDDDNKNDADTLVVAGSRDAVRKAGLTSHGNVFILGTNIHLQGKRVDHLIIVGQHPVTIDIWLKSPYVTGIWAHRTEPPTIEYV